MPRGDPAKKVEREAEIWNRGVVSEFVPSYLLDAHFYSFSFVFIHLRQPSLLSPSTAYERRSSLRRIVEGE